MNHDNGSPGPRAGRDTSERASEQVDRLLAGNREAGALVESLDRDEWAAAQLAAMIPPPHDPEEIAAMRDQSDGNATDGDSTDRERATHRTPSDGDEKASDRPGESQWVDEGGAVTDWPDQPDTDEDVPAN